jgi:uncharacterized protein
MNGTLSGEAIRVLGVMIEKELSTPEYYPLTLNALKTACNQKSNRHPVVAYSESDVIQALDELEKWRLVGHASGAGSRARKYRHAAREAIDLSPAETAVMACLFLRGQQTPGEIKGRTGRLFDFESLSQLDQTLEGLMRREEPLVESVQRRAGQKEDRFKHLMGIPESDQQNQSSVESGIDEARELAGSPFGQDEFAHGESSHEASDLRAQVVLLRDEMDRLRTEFDTFREQFD